MEGDRLLDVFQCLVVFTQLPTSKIEFFVNEKDVLRTFTNVVALFDNSVARI